MKKIIMVFFSILFIGCSTKHIEIDKKPNCRINTVPSPIFVEMAYISPRRVNTQSLPAGDLYILLDNLKKKIEQYFPRAGIIKIRELLPIQNRKYSMQVLNSYLSYLSKDENLYYISIGGIYGVHNSYDITPVTTINSGQSFSGFTNYGNYYSGTIMPSSSTTWVPVSEKSILLTFGFKVFNKYWQSMFNCNVTTSSIGDLYKEDWIDNCMKKLVTCTDKNSSE